MELWKYENESGDDTNVTQICGPELTDKFGMWRVMGGGRVVLPRDRAVAIVTDGAGSVNGIDVKKGERLLVCGENSVEAQGNAALVVCA